MLGTGLSASSLSESTMPSRISSSSTVGTYCRQIGSSGDLIRSTMAGEMRNSKFSAARRRRSSSGNRSGPNLAASASSDMIEFFLSTSCQFSMALPVLSCLPTASGQRLHVDDLIVARRVEVGYGGRDGIAAGLIEGAGGPVIRTAGGFHHDEAGDAHEAPLHGMEQYGA